MSGHNRCVPHQPLHVAHIVRRNGGAASYRMLDALAVSRADVRRARAAGAVVQIRERWFGVPDAPADVVRAVQVGGSLTAASVLRLEGVWLRADPVLHVRVPRTAGRLWAPDGRHDLLDRDAHRVCVHYRTDPRPLTARDPLTLALAELVACAPRLDAVIALDSAFSLRRLDAVGLSEVRELMMVSRREIVDLVDPGCQSGTETIVRLLLRGRRVRHRSQVWIDGVGRVDLLVGDRLVIEIDGAGFHTGTEFERDRRRDFELVMRGYLVLRLSYSLVMSEWDTVSDGVLALIERGEHRWGHRARSEDHSGVRSVARKHVDPDG
jgi:very-short-patch-repair endonuclease